MEENTKTIFVDKSSADGAISVASTQTNVSVNLNFNKPPKEDSVLYSIGKYICIHVVNSNEALEMIYLDFKANPKNCMAVVSNMGFSNNEMQKLTSMIELVNSEYEERKDKFNIKIVDPQ